jgi:hypothetical protein
MSGLRLHMLRGSRNRPPHMQFLKRCETCNNDIIDETNFSDNHGLNCDSHHPIRKGDAADIQYQMFCTTVLQTRAVEVNTSYRE